MSPLKALPMMGLVAIAMVAAGCAASAGEDGLNPTTEAIIVNHTSTNLEAIPSTWIDQAKQKLHIAYGTTSHGSQLVTGMDGLVIWLSGGPQYAHSFGGAGGALDLRAYIGNFGGLNIANGLEYDAAGNVSYTAWERATRAFLATDPGVNVIMWAWCWGANSGIPNMTQYISLMEGLEKDFPNVKFVYMTGRTNGFPTEMPDYEDNEYIRNYCLTHNKILYDFYDIECYDPDGSYFGDKGCNENCDYDSNNDGRRDANWAINWQNAHPSKWYNCVSEHSQPLNANQKAFAAWHLWARLAGWDGKS
jgi:hypothetical protein